MMGKKDKIDRSQIEIISLEDLVPENHSLQEEITKDREAHGKKPLKEKEKSEPETKNIKTSTTDPDSGLFHKGEHKKVFAYASNTACDKNNYISRMGKLYGTGRRDKTYHRYERNI